MRKIKKFSLLIASLLVFTTSVYSSFYKIVYDPNWMSARVDSQVHLHVKFVGNIIGYFYIPSAYECNAMAIWEGGQAWAYNPSRNECQVLE